MIVKDDKSTYYGDTGKVGLGLFISKHITEKFGGDLNFVSTPNEGSTFIFSFNVKVDEEAYKNQLDS